MTALSRQNALFVSEDWTRIYEAITNVDFRAYDMTNLSNAIYAYLRASHPDEFNDWIASSEFVMKVEVLAWLSQNLSYRVDLNTRENFLATAERRDSLLRLASYIAYKINRVRSASGDVKLVSIRTTQTLVDSDNVNLANRQITWNDPKNDNWFEQFITVMNAAFTNRTQYGRPFVTYQNESIKVDQYVMNSISQDSGTYSFNASVNGTDVPFEIYNSTLDTTAGLYSEIDPGLRHAINVFYKQDGHGFASANTGFFFPIKQGRLQSQDVTFTQSVSLRTVTLNATNVNDTDVFVEQLDADGNVATSWTEVDTLFGEGVSFNPDSDAPRTVFEVDTLANDQIRVRFGDGSFGQIPVGTFRIWTRSANPTALIIKPNMIRNQTITLPYIANNQVYYLQIVFSLQAALVNAAPTETNDDIRTRANKLFYTQNRMITAQDYNNFFFKDNSIVKEKAVNRTFAGHSRYTKLHDPTGMYENIRHVADDGRLYQNDTMSLQTQPANTITLPLKTFVDTIVRPILLKEDKRGLYYAKYPEIYVEGFDNYQWRTTYQVGTQSTGNVTKNNTVIPVGPTATDAYFRYLTTDATFRLTSVYGSVAHVTRLIDDGSDPNTIVLSETITGTPRIVSIFPAFRNDLFRSEENAIENAMQLNSDFGLRWDYLNQEWKVIGFNDLDRTSEFSLEHTGDTSGTHLDASWIVRFIYLPGQNGGEPQWEVTDRGVGLFFESAEQIDFYYTDATPVIDPVTGYAVQDTVRLLPHNESRDSLRRRGIATLGSDQCGDYAFTFVGDGTTTDFKVGVNPLDPNKTIVLVDGLAYGYNIAYTIIRSVTGDIIRFFTAPAVNAQIIIRVSNSFALADISVVEYTADGVATDFDLGVRGVLAENVITFLDGIIQNPSLNYGIGTASNGNSTLVFNSVIADEVRIVAHVFSGITSPIFSKTHARGDGETTGFTIPTIQQTLNTIFITLDGAYQAKNTYTLQQTGVGTNITFTTAPGNNVHVVIWSTINPAYTRIMTTMFGGDGTTTEFELVGLTNARPRSFVVAINGVCQIGNYSGSGGTWDIPDRHTLTFETAPPAASIITVLGVLSSVGSSGQADLLDNTPDNLGDTGPDVTSCSVTYFGRNIDMWVADALRYDDGYTNTSGVMVRPTDVNRAGFYDQPFLFRELVIQNGTQDLVLWRRTQAYGQDIWKGINSGTIPAGTYGYSNVTGQPILNGTLATGVVHGDIHYDQATSTWLVADTIEEKWIAATNQADYKYLIGRDNLKFEWFHYSPEAARIDPSPSNIHDIYLLTSGYDTAIRTWIQQGAAVVDMPIPPTPESLQIQYASFNAYKAMSDSMILNPMRYKPLFGPSALAQLQATFKMIQTPGSGATQNDLSLQVLASLTEFFAVKHWNAGEQFFFTELSAFIHTRLAPNIQTFVIVPKYSNYAFGRMFQVQAEPDELFISTAGLADIEFIDALTDEDLRIGTFSG